MNTLQGLVLNIGFTKLAETSFTSSMKESLTVLKYSYEEREKLQAQMRHQFGKIDEARRRWDPVEVREIASYMEVLKKDHDEIEKAINTGESYIQRLMAKVKPLELTALSAEDKELSEGLDFFRSVEDKDGVKMLEDWEFLEDELDTSEAVEEAEQREAAVEYLRSNVFPKAKGLWDSLPPFPAPSKETSTPSSTSPSPPIPPPPKKIHPPVTPPKATSKATSKPKRTTPGNTLADTPKRTENTQLPPQTQPTNYELNLARNLGLYPELGNVGQNLSRLGIAGNVGVGSYLGGWKGGVGAGLGTGLGAHLGDATRYGLGAAGLSIGDIQNQALAQQLGGFLGGSGGALAGMKV